MPDDLFELERAFDRTDLAALFGEFAAAFEEPRPAAVEGDGTRLEIDPPPRATVELEVERGGEDADSTDERDGDESTGDGRDEEAGEERGGPLPPTIELEIELEWDETDEGPGSVRFVDLVDEKVEQAAADEAQTTLSEPTAEGAGEAEPDAVDEGTIPSEADPSNGASEGAEPEPGAGNGAVASDSSGGDGDASSAPDARRSRFEVYRDRADEWRWRLVHWNGNVVADGGEGYASRYNAKRAARAVMRTAPDARIDDED